MSKILSDLGLDRAAEGGGGASQSGEKKKTPPPLISLEDGMNQIFVTYDRLLFEVS